MAIVSMTPAVAGNVATAAENNKLITNIVDLDSRLQVVEGNTGGIGVVGIHRPTAAVTSAGQTEKVACFLTFNAVAGRRYKFTWNADLSSSAVNSGNVTSNNPAGMRIRVKAGSDTTAIDGTLVDGRDMSGLSNGYNTQTNMIADWRATTTQQVTVVVTIRATTVATGNVTQAYDANNHTPKLIVEDIGAI